MSATSLVAAAYDATRATSSFDENDGEDDPATRARKELARLQQQSKQIDQARMHEFLRALVWGGSTPAAATHRKAILLLDEQCDRYKGSAEFAAKSLALTCVKDFVEAQRGRLTLTLWDELLLCGDGASPTTESDEVLMRRVELALGPGRASWLVVCAPLAPPQLLRCVCLHLLCGRLHANTRVLLVVSTALLSRGRMDDLRVFPSVARHACTTTVVCKTRERRAKIFAVGDCARLGIVAVPDRWSRDLQRTSAQRRDEYGDSVLSADALTTAGVALVEDVLTSSDALPLVRFHPRFGNGAAFVANVASALRFNYVTHTVDVSDSGCADEPMAEFAPSLRASRKLTTLVVSRCHLTDRGMIELAKAVRDCGSLTALDVSENTLVTTDGICALAMALALEAAPPLQSDDMAAVATTAAAAAGSSPSRSHSVVGGGPQSALNLLSSLPSYSDDGVGAPACKLRSLSVAGCNSISATRTMWSADGIRLFFRYLGRCTALRHLDLSNNSLVEEDALAFATFCVPPPRRYGDDVVEASQLYQQDQQQHDGGAASAASDYRTSEEIEAELLARKDSLSLGHRVTAAQLLSPSSSIAATGLSGLMNSNHGAQRRAAVGLPLESLVCGGNGIGDAGAAIILTRLAGTLRKVDFSHCGLSARALVYCGLCVSRHPTLRELRLSYNDLSWERALRVRTTSSSGGNSKIESWLKADGGLREALENVPASVSMSALDVSVAGASSSDADGTEELKTCNGVGGLMDGDYNYDRTRVAAAVAAGATDSSTSAGADASRKLLLSSPAATRSIAAAAPTVRGFGRDSNDESQFCWFMDRFLQFVHAAKTVGSSGGGGVGVDGSKRATTTGGNADGEQQQLAIALDVSHCVLATATVRTLLEGGVLRGLVAFESLSLSGNYGVRGETVSLLMGEVAGHARHSQTLRELRLDDVDAEVRERALIGVFLAASSAFEKSGKDALEERSSVTGQVLAKKDRAERHRARLELLSCRGPELTDGMLYAIRQCPREMLPPLRFLDLSRCTILAGGAETIATTAARLPQLETLILREIWFAFFAPDVQKVVSLGESREHGLPIVRHFADLVMDSASLRFLDLSENGFGTVAARCLLGAVAARREECGGGGGACLQKLLLGKNSAVDWAALRQASNIAPLFDPVNPVVLY